MKRLVRVTWQILVYHLLLLPALLLFRHKNIWLVSERGDDARDNGYWMFRYLRKKHPEINAFYVIDRASSDYSKVISFGNVIQKGSVQHWLYFLAARVRMSTHLFLFAPAPYAGAWLKRHPIRNSICVDLNHGVNHNYYPSLESSINRSDLFVCGAKPEREWILRNCGWAASAIRYTGLARFDGLYAFQAKRQILVMPTWRTELRDISEDMFLKSKYYNKWSEFLNSTFLKDVLDSEHVDLVFYIHYSLQRFRSLFQNDNPRIVIASFDEYDVQTLLKESALLITDYSSIFFDFAYMRKPLIYYQFDREDFYSKHYQRGYFDHRRDGFGPCVNQLEELLASIKQFITNGFAVDPQYANRATAFFPLYDQHNCERIYQAIQEALHEKTGK